VNSIFNQSKKLNLPIILNDTKVILEDLIKENKPNLILEIGAAIGYSASVMLNACDTAKLITLEKNVERFKICKENLARVAGVRAEVINCDAMEFIENTNLKFDFIFIDGPKGQYLNYIKKLESKLSKNAIVMCDNIYFHGMVNGKTPVTKGVRTMIRNLKKFNEYMLHNKNFETQILEKGDGILIAKYTG